MNKKEESDAVKKRINSLIQPIFDKVPQETIPNHRMVGSATMVSHGKNTISRRKNKNSVPDETKEPWGSLPLETKNDVKEVIFLWQPHNYRLYFDFCKKGFSPKKPCNHTLRKYKSMVPVFDDKYKITMVNHGSEAKFENFMFCTIRVKKTQVEVINNFHHKQWRKITAGSIDQVHERIDRTMQDLRDGAIRALRTLIEFHGGRSDYTILYERCEHGIHGEDYLDKIPNELIINDTYFKKMYKEKVEFKSAPAIKNYISNRAVENIAPSIAEEMAASREIVKGVLDINASTSRVLSDFVTKFLPIHAEHAVNIRTHTKVLKGIDSSFKKFNRLLSTRQKRLGDF